MTKENLHNDIKEATERKQMNKKAAPLILLFLLAFYSTKAQSIEVLREKIDKVIAHKSATVGVAIKGINPRDTISINGNKHLPMQSVYKYHLALAVLHQVDQGKLRLDKVISLDKELMDSYMELWSPLRKKYPNGGEVTLADIIKNTVAWSDNVGCDVLFKLVGGTHVVQSYLHDIGIEDIAIVHTEIVMQEKWENQYENWTTAKAANQALQLFYENADELLSTESYTFLLNILKGTQTGKRSFRGLVPEETIIAHKTGHSGKNDIGLTGALNDIGIVFLPDNSYFYLSIMVSDSMENNDVNHEIIAKIAKLTWDYFKNK